MRRMLVIGLLLASAGRAGGDPPGAGGRPVADAERPLTAEQAADAVLAAVEAEDHAALRALALKDEPDPWLVADALLARRDGVAAESFARAAARPDVERLPEYVTSRRDEPDNPRARVALSSARAAMDRHDPREAIDALRGMASAPRTVSGVLIACLRAEGLRALGQLEASSKEYRDVASVAEAMGWLRRLRTSLELAASAAYARADYPMCLDLWTRLAGIQERRGDRLGVGVMLGNMGMAHDALGHSEEALDFYDRALELKEELGDRAGAAATLGNIGVVHFALGNYPKALAYYERALRVHEELGERARAAGTLVNIGLAQRALGEYVRALESHERALRIDEEIDNREGVAADLGNLGSTLAALGNLAKALEYKERALKLSEELGDREGVATGLLNIASTRYALGDYAKALEHYRRGLKASEEIGDRRSAAMAYEGIGSVHHAIGDYGQAREFKERALRMREDLGDRAGKARTLANLGVVHASFANYPEALECQERALRTSEELGDRALTATVLGNIGRVESSLGNFARALAALERALAVAEAVGDREGVAYQLSALGTLHSRFGDPARALEYLERALRRGEEVGGRTRSAAILGDLGMVHASIGNHAKALELHQRALAVVEAAGKRPEIARTLANIGLSHDSLGMHREALEDFVRALAIMEDIGARDDAAQTRGNIGTAHARLGDAPRALEALGRAVNEARDLGARDVLLFALHNLARLRLERGDAREALRLAEEAVDVIGQVATGLSDDQGTAVRGKYSDTYDLGTQASVALSDVERTSFFLESGRAGALLESLPTRGALPAAVLPEPLRVADAAARRRERSMGIEYRRSLDRGDLDDIRMRRSALTVAQEELRDVVARIQREQKGAASLLYPRADRLAAIRQRVRANEALVVYSLVPGGPAFALVVAATEARVVALGKSADVEAAAAAMAPSDRSTDPTAAAAVLRAITVDSLRLPAGVTRLLVCPEGMLSYVPFSLLVPDRDIAHVPSGTTYGVLRDEAGSRGVGVLALGDPDYGAGAHERAAAVLRGGLRLTPLPGTREEAQTVGDVVLVGRSTTESGFRAAITARERWHAVHFACHGIVDPERPAFSSLALTPSGDDDGFLTCLEVFRTRIPADLVVLSACETGRGKVVRGEGIVGFTRAFMFAGAPRVICSLWKVDDAATRALMAKFYALWNPKDGSAPLGAAAALRAAQSGVRDFEVEARDEAASQEAGREIRRRTRPWSHPYYWAAWALWGLPD